jgi:outer membrane protein W
MKKLFILALLAATAGTSYAQGIKAGTVSLGGSIGYSQFSGENTATTSSSGGPIANTSMKSTGRQFYLSPAVSYFVADNLAVGLNLGYTNGVRTEDAVYTPAVTYSQHNKLTSISLWAGAFAQYYKMINAQFGLTGRLGAGYQRARETRNGQTNDGRDIFYFSGTTANSGYYADLTPGIIFFPVPKFGISATLGSVSFSHYGLTYSNYSDTNGNTNSQGTSNDSDTFGANFGLNSFLLGGTYYFGR